MPLEEFRVAQLEQALDSQYAELLDEIREELAQSGDGQYIELLGRGGTDAGEEAVRDLLWGLNAALFDRHIHQLRNIENARVRIREGSYGICTDCGDEIAFERLRARPAAKRCIYCQQQHERRHAQVSTSNL
ncbi:MAG: TraR/DksA family transcriptional regulator [Burkholderiales bacterium]|jgi:RNA polymerase-binding protein DksA